MTTPNPEPSGPPLRAIAMVLIAFAILFAGLGAASLGGSDSAEAAPEPATSSAAAPTSAAAQAPATTTPAAAPVVTTTSESAPTSSSTATSTATTAAVDRTVPVRVFNNSTVSGLAAQTAGELTSRGWNVSETGNYSYGLIRSTTVYYGNTAAEKRAAEAIAAELGVSAEPRFAGIASASPGVIVIVTSG